MTNYKKKMELNLAYIIAELNTSHNGDLQVAKKMVIAARESGADCVKFQSFSPESLYSETYFDSNPMVKRIFNKVSLSETELYDLSLFCTEVGLDFSSTAYNYSEIDFLSNECNPAFLKIASMDINNYDFLRHVAKKKLPIILSTGMSSFNEVQIAVNVLNENGDRDITILHCTSNYPTESKDVSLKNILTLQKMFPSNRIGFSDHTIGYLAPVLAIGMGAAVIEKHFTLDNRLIGLDNQMAANPDEFMQMVEKIRVAEIILGSTSRVIGDEELAMSFKMRRSLVLNKSKLAGEKILLEDLEAKRPGNFISVSNKDYVLGRTLKHDKKIGSYLTDDDIL